MGLNKEQVLQFLAERENLAQTGMESEGDRVVRERLFGGKVVYQSLRERILRGQFDEITEKVPLDQIDVPVKLKVRAKAPGTSWEAAASIAPEKSRLLYERILWALQSGSKHDDELRHHLKKFLEEHKFSPEGVTMRRGELVKAGWVRKSGLRRKGDSGASMNVWELTP